MLHWNDITPVHRREWIKPSAESSAERFEIPVANDQVLDLLLRLADISVKAASLHPGTMGRDQLARMYQRWAAANSALSPGNSIRHRVMAKALSHSFNQISGSLAAMGPAACVLQLGPTIGSIARSKPKPAHPLKHLTLIACMFEGWDSFWSTYADDSARQSNIQGLNQQPSMTVPDQDLGAEFVKLVKESNFSVRQASAALGVSTSTGVRWAKTYCIDFTPRPKSLTAEYLENVREQLRTGKEKADVIAATQISSVSLNRLLSSEPTLRVQWHLAKSARLRMESRKKFLDALKKHSGVPIWLVRKLPNTGWYWLYRHDRQWLIQNTPALWSMHVDDP